ncbi:MAG: hypothetical protein ACOYLQ_18645 [Hyphomicrobiaceae bacterium]
MSASKTSEDRALVERLVAILSTETDGLRTGTMFGWSAAYAGRKLAFCVRGSIIGMKLPAAEAQRLILASEAAPFRPYGKPPMREWVEVPVDPDDLSPLLPLLRQSVRHAGRDA